MSAPHFVADETAMQNTNPFSSLQGQKFSIIYADPPWQYRDKSLNRGGAARHYSTLDINDIKSLPVREISQNDSLLFMWATFPNLPEAFEVITAWGFEYNTGGFTWVKKNRKSDGLFMGMGSLTRSNAEICLIGKRGKGVSRVSASVRQTQVHPIERHSKKPDAFRDSIVELCGAVPKVELFARDHHPGWKSWGDEINNSTEGEE